MIELHLFLLSRSLSLSLRVSANESAAFFFFFVCSLALMEAEKRREEKYIFIQRCVPQHHAHIYPFGRKIAREKALGAFSSFSSFFFSRHAAVWVDVMLQGSTSRRSHDAQRITMQDKPVGMPEMGTKMLVSWFSFSLPSRALQQNETGQTL